MSVMSLELWKGSSLLVPEEKSFPVITRRVNVSFLRDDPRPPVVYMKNKARWRANHRALFPISAFVLSYNYFFGDIPLTYDINARRQVVQVFNLDLQFDNLSVHFEDIYRRLFVGKEICYAGGKGYVKFF